MIHTTPTIPGWVEPCADLEHRVEHDYSRSTNRIVVRRYRLADDTSNEREHG